MFEIVRYTPDRRDEWNCFVAKAKNATFLFDRGYMDYHSDRFQDCSLMIYRKGHLYALLPANGRDGVLYSHQGLTYGGLLLDEHSTAGHVCEVFETLNSWLRCEGFRRVVYKPVPRIYQQLPAEEDLYALFLRCRARLVERDVSSTIVLDRQLPFAESRRSGLRKARRAGIQVRPTDDLAAFWQILEGNLARQYGAKPAHTMSEMQLLMERFPRNIQLFMAYSADGTPLGGTVLYLTSQVAHTQYISASPEGKRKGVLDLLFDSLLSKADFSQRYFDFGTSARGDSSEVNEQLIFQKEGFGGRAVCYDIYEWKLS